MFYVKGPQISLQTTGQSVFQTDGFLEHLKGKQTCLMRQRDNSSGRLGQEELEDKLGELGFGHLAARLVGPYGVL